MKLIVLNLNINYVEIMKKIMEQKYLAPSFMCKL